MELTAFVPFFIGGSVLIVIAVTAGSIFAYRRYRQKKRRLHLREAEEESQDIFNMVSQKAPRMARRPQRQQQQPATASTPLASSGYSFDGIANAASPMIDSAMRTTAQWRQSVTDNVKSWSRAIEGSLPRYGSPSSSGRQYMGNPGSGYSKLASDAPQSSDSGLSRTRSTRLSPSPSLSRSSSLTSSATSSSGAPTKETPLLAAGPIITDRRSSKRSQQQRSRQPSQPRDILLAKLKNQRNAAAAAGGGGGVGGGMGSPKTADEKELHRLTMMTNSSTDSLPQMTMKEYAALRDERKNRARLERQKQLSRAAAAASVVFTPESIPTSLPDVTNY